MSASSTKAAPAQLKRSLSLTFLILYGLGVTIGAGIYVLIGETAGRAGLYAPLSFLLAALIMSFSAASFAALSVRLPVSAGEAAYIKAGFKSSTLSLIVGLLVTSSGIISAAAISVGSAGYIQQFISLPSAVLIIFIVAAMALISLWGIVQSVFIAGLLTLIEIGGLLLIIVSAAYSEQVIFSHFDKVFPPSFTMPLWAPILSTALLAFFAFVGFEDMVNVAEEVQNPARNLPIAIFVTLVVTTLIYFLICAIAVLSTPLAELSQSKAPLSLVFARVTNLPPSVITLIAIIATLNGVIVQMIMASRVLYGLAKMESLPKFFGTVHPRTHTPIFSTLVVATLILTFALALPIDALAEMTSRIILSIFILVNSALILIKRREQPGTHHGFDVGLWVPVLGVFSCCFLLAMDFLL